MKNTMLWGALLTLICTQGHADLTQQATPTQASDTTVTAVSAGNTNPTPQQNQANQPAQSNTQPLTNQNVQTQVQMPAEQQKTPVINCEYKIPPEVKKIDPSLVLTWSEKATTQAFDFNSESIDTQMQQLKNCFTEQGWGSFNNALQKSGNVDAIKTQKLTVSSLIDGKSQVIEANEVQWKISLPLQVVYQNSREKVTQLLNVNLTIGRKLSGDLGIMQMVATPRITNTTQQHSAESTHNSDSVTNTNNIPNTSNTNSQNIVVVQPTPSNVNAPNGQVSESITMTPNSSHSGQ